jgi:hypothetical protein
MISLADMAKFNQNRNNIHPVFRRFYLIKDAVTLSERNGKLPIFSCDKPKSKIKGAKLFYTSSYERFWNYYSITLKEEDRCYYETLLPDLYSHLYADIEASKLTNKDVDFEKLYGELIEDLKKFIVKILGVDTNEIRILELDSSTQKKFSKHCIIKIKDCYFKNNFHCGAFMRRFQKSLIENHGLPKDGNKYFVWGEKETNYTNESLKICFVDLGVYTLRRQFRLLGSSKRSEVRRYMWLKDKKDQLEKGDFFDCLIQYVPRDAKIKHIYEVMEIDGSEPYSSSLKTFDEKGNPISIAQNGSSSARQPILDIKTMNLKQVKRKLDVEYQRDPKKTKKLIILPLPVQQALQKYYHKKYKYNIKSYVISEDKFKLETYDVHCFIRKELTGDPNHTSNHVYLILYLNSFLTYQGCYNENICKQKKKLLHDLGKIDETIEEGRDLIKVIKEWQKTIQPKKEKPIAWIPIKSRKKGKETKKQKRI